MATSPDLSGAMAFVRTSNLNPALRLFGSGPWQVRQLSDRIGRISRLKSILSFDFPCDAIAAGEIIKQTMKRRITRQPSNQCKRNVMTANDLRATEYSKLPLERL